MLRDDEAAVDTPLDLFERGVRRLARTATRCTADTVEPRRAPFIVLEGKATWRSGFARPTIVTSRVMEFDTERHAREYYALLRHERPGDPTVYLCAVVHHTGLEDGAPDLAVPQLQHGIPGPLVRSGDAPTGASSTAAATVSKHGNGGRNPEKFSPLQARVMLMLLLRPGCTDDQLSALLPTYLTTSGERRPFAESSVRKRRTDLVAMGFVQDSGTTLPNRLGNPSTVWEPVEARRAEAERLARATLEGDIASPDP